MRPRSIQLRWHGRCCVCLSELAAGEIARYDPVVHEITCSRCTAGLPPLERPEPAPPSRRSASPSRPLPRHLADEAQVRALIAETRAKLDAARRAS